jgi:hypothetical protein
MAASDGRTDTRQSEDNSDFSRIENTLKNIEGESSKIGTWVCYANKIRKQV